MKNRLAALAWILGIGCASRPPEPERTPEPEPPLVEVKYDVQDFKAGEEVPDFSGPKDKDGTVPRDAASLAAVVIRSLLTRGHVEASGGRVVVQATAEEQEAVAKAIAFLGRRDEYVITVQTRFVEAARPLDGRSRLHSAVVPTSQAMEWLQEPSVKTLQAPRISVFDAQQSHVSVCNQFAYIRDYEVRFSRDGDWIPDPQPDVVTFGIALSIRPARISEEGAVLLGDLRIVLSDLQLDPPDVIRLRTPYGVKERPNLDELTLVLNPIVPPGHTLVVGPLVGPWGRCRNTWILVECAVEPVKK